MLFWSWLEKMRTYKKGNPNAVEQRSFVKTWHRKQNYRERKFISPVKPSTLSQTTTSPLGPMNALFVSDEAAVVLALEEFWRREMLGCTESEVGEMVCKALLNVTCSSRRRPPEGCGSDGLCRTRELLRCFANSQKHLRVEHRTALIKLGRSKVRKLRVTQRQSPDRRVRTPPPNKVCQQ